jgi:hypothetical protein
MGCVYDAVPAQGLAALGIGAAVGDTFLRRDPAKFLGKSNGTGLKTRHYNAETIYG